MPDRRHSALKGRPIVTADAQPTPFAEALATVPMKSFERMAVALKKQGITVESRTFESWLSHDGTESSRHSPAGWIRKIIIESLGLGEDAMDELWPDEARGRFDPHSAD